MSACHVSHVLFCFFDSFSRLLGIFSGLVKIVCKEIFEKIVKSYLKTDFLINIMKVKVTFELVF